MPATKKCIRFIHSWRGHEPGDENHELDLAVMDALVVSGRAEWCVCDDEQMPAKPKRRKK